MRGGRPVCVDLFCGLGGWTKGFQAAGFYTIGVDITHFDGYPGDEFVQADIRTVDGRSGMESPPSWPLRPVMSSACFGCRGPASATRRHQTCHW